MPFMLGVPLTAGRVAARRVTGATRRGGVILMPSLDRIASNGLRQQDVRMLYGLVMTTDSCDLLSDVQIVR
jgi:hypothetical protein